MNCEYIIYIPDCLQNKLSFPEAMLRSGGCVGKSVLMLHQLAVSGHILLSVVVVLLLGDSVFVLLFLSLCSSILFSSMIL